MTHLEQEAIRTNLAVLLEPSGVYEMRVIGTRQATRSGYFKDIGEMAMVAANQNGDGLGPFITLNPVKPDLLARANGVLKPWAKHTTANADILRRRFIPIDLDAERSAGISSTEAEHDKARARAFMVFEFLSSEGVPLDAMVVADSGNGGHVLVRVDLPNDDDATALVRNLLSALHSKFSDEVVKVDTTSSNAARIWRVYGTVNNKGDSIPDRPHRMTSILRKPEALEITPVDILEKLAAMAPNKGGGGRRVSGDRRGRGDPGRGSEPGDLKGWLDEHGLVVTKEKHLGNGITYSLGTCPYSDAHDDGAWATEFDTGARSAGCHHDSCDGKDWTALKKLIEGDPSHSLTDLGNAERLVALHGQDLRYCFAFKAWFIWDGILWRRDDTGEIVRRAKDSARSIFAEAADVADDVDRKKVVKHARRSESETALKAMVSLARSEPDISVLPEELDADRWSFNLLNGTVDLRTGELRPHRREDLLTKLVEVEYDPDAKCPNWDSFLQRIMGGNEELVRFIQRAAGYSLTGVTREQVMFILHGSGDNGKTTLLKTLYMMLRDYAKRTPTTMLMVKRDGAIPNDVARLMGARFVYASEGEAEQRLAEAQIKDMTGDDPISARFMRAEWFEFVPRFKIWFATNHKPQIRGGDDAIWDRIRLIPFKVSIPEEEQDKELTEKLRAEFPGILNWAIEGCLEWQRDGLGVPDAVKAANSEYRAEMDVISAFIEDRCEVGEGQQVASGTLYLAYNNWCDSEDLKPETKNKFGRSLTTRGFIQDRTDAGRIWRGLSIPPASLHPGTFTTEDPDGARD